MLSTSLGLSQVSVSAQKSKSLSTVQSLISKALLQIERELNKAKSQCLEFKEPLFSRVPGSDCVASEMSFELLS